MATGVTVRNINIDVKVDAKSAIAQLERLERALDGLKKATLDIGDTKKKVGDIKKSISDISKSASAAAKNISELKKMAAGTGKASGELSKKTKQAKSSLDGLRKTIGKLLLCRAIRQTLMMIGNSFREGLKYVKEYSNAVQNSQFSDMFASYTEMGTELKATLGVSLASVLEALEPIALGLATTLQFVADAFNQFFAAINGESTYMKVNTAYVEEYSKSLKEAKRQVMGFDELNKLSGNEIDYSKLYVETELTDGMVALGAAITAALGAMAAEEVIGFVTKLGNAKKAVEDLTGVVGDKNKALGDESKALDLDGVKAAELAAGLVGAGGLLFGVKKLIDYLKEHPIEIGDKASEALTYIQVSFEFTKALFKNTVLTVVIGVTNFFARAKELLAETATAIAAKTFTVVIGITNFLATVKSRLSETATAVAEKVFVVTIGITNFLATAKARLAQLGDEIKASSLNVIITVSDFLQSAKDMLEDVGVAVAKESFTVAIGIYDFVKAAGEKLETLGDDIKNVAFTVSIGISDFVKETANGLIDVGKKIASESFTVAVKVYDFVSDLKEKLKQAAAAIKGFFVNLFSKDDVVGDTVSSGNFKEARMDDVKGTSSSASIPSWLSGLLGIASFVQKQWLGLFGIGDYSILSIGENVFGNKIVQECIKAIVEGLATGLGFFASAFTGVPAFANGGYPSTGSMFIAGEAGPEIVGNINGKTGVASGDEVTGIRTAVYSIGEAIVDAINNKDMNASIRLDDGTIYKASQRGAKRVGNSLIQFAR